MEKVIKLATKVAQHLDTENFKQTEIETYSIDGIEFCAINIDGEISVSATTRCDGNQILIASSESPILLHSIATCVANMLGFFGEWTFNSIQQEIEKEKQSRIEWSMFCEEQGWDN